MKCRHCSSAVTLPFVDLGSAPLSNAYLSSADLEKSERWFPLRVMVCSMCWLVQTQDFSDAEVIFAEDYAYFSSYSSTWLNHAANYVERVIDRFQLDRTSLVVELAANDGYLLQYVAMRSIPCFGVEPTASTAAAARSKGIEIVQDFFGSRLARELISNDRKPDLVIANNVLAHVPDINDFVSGIAILLADRAVCTFEFPHLLSLVANNQYDTIYHEHYSYLSLTAVARILAQHGLHVFDVEEVPTHGGSLRVYAQNRSAMHRRTPAVASLLEREKIAGIMTEAYYLHFQARIDKAKNDFLKFILDAKQKNKKIAAYGAAAKGNTLLNYAGLRSDLVPYVADKNPAKIGKFLPGSRIPIVSDNRIREERPDFIIILPWNIRDEVAADLSYANQWGARFVTAIPQLHVTH